MKRSFAIVLICAAVVLGADSPVQLAVPKSLAATNAVAKELALEAQANAACRKAIIAAKHSEVTDLKNAQRSTLASGDVDDATTIALLIKQVEADIGALDGSAIKVTVLATKPSVIHLETGVYKVKAAGTWAVGPVREGWKMIGPAGYGRTVPAGLTPAAFAAFPHLGCLAFKAGKDADALFNSVYCKAENAGETFYSEDMTLNIESPSYISLRQVDDRPETNEGSVNVTLTRVR